MINVMYVISITNNKKVLASYYKESLLPSIPKKGDSIAINHEDGDYYEFDVAQITYKDGINTIIVKLTTNKRFNTQEDVFTYMEYLGFTES